MSDSLPPMATIRRWMVGFTAFGLAVALGLAGWASYRSYQHLTDGAETAVDNLSQLLLGSVGALYDSSDAALRVVGDAYAREAADKRGDLAEVTRTMQRQLERHPDLTVFGIADPAGRVLMGRTRNGTPEGVLASTAAVIGSSDDFKALRRGAGDGLVVSRPLSDSISGDWGLVLARRLLGPDGQSAGVVFTRLPAARIQHRFAELSLGSQGSIAVRDAQLRLVARHPADAPAGAPAIAIGDTRISTDFRDALALHPDGARYTSGSTAIDGVPRLHSYRRHPVHGFHVNVGLARAEMLAPWIAEFSITGLIVLGLSLALVLGCAFVLVAWHERELALAQVLRSERRLRAIFEAAAVPGMLVAANDEILALNRAMGETFGYTAADLPGMAQWWEQACLPGPQCELARLQWVRHADRPGHAFEPLQVSLLCRDGSRKDALLTAAALGDAYPGVRVLSLTDITPLQRALADLQLQSEITAHSAEGINLVSASDGRILYTNARFDRMFGYAPGELAGQPISIVNAEDPASPSQTDMAKAILDAVHAHGMWHGEVRNRRKDGSQFWTEAHVSSYQHPMLGTVMITHQSDITERRRAAQAQRELNEELEARVAERTAELQRAKEAAEQASEAKTRFLANMSHELRTPMNGIMGMTELVRRKISDPRLASFLDKAQAASRQLLVIIDDILDLSRIETGVLVLRTGPMSVLQVTEHACSLLEPPAHGKGLAFEVDVEPWLAQAWFTGDLLRLQQVLVNLAGNAVKFTHTGSVRIRVRRQMTTGTVDMLRWEVQDTGIGIPPEHQERIFHRFEQVDDSMSRAYGGTGLGLAICKRLVDAMGGEIGVVSTPGAGSCFWFTTPLPRCAAPPGRKGPESTLPPPD